MRTRRLFAATLTGLACGAVTSATADAGFRTFQTPSKRIGCAYITGKFPAMIRCDLFFLDDRAVVLEHRGRPRKIRITDTVGDPKARVLAYGTTTRFGSFSCTSRTSGLTCRSRRSGHGFTVSRQAQKLF